MVFCFFCCAESLLLHRPFSSFRLLTAVASPAVEQALQRLWPMGSVAAGPRLYSTVSSAVVEHSLSCSAAYGIFLEEGSNLCALPWWADSYPLHHQGSPKKNFFLSIKKVWEIQAIISQFQLGLLSTAAIYAPKGKRSYVLG